LQNAVSQRTFAVINMGDNRKIADKLLLHRHSLADLQRYYFRIAAESTFTKGILLIVSKICLKNYYKWYNET
jgi:hypothetical protein